MVEMLSLRNKCKDIIVYLPIFIFESFGHHWLRGHVFSKHKLTTLQDTCSCTLNHLSHKL